MATVDTSFGTIPLEILVKRYENEKKREAKKYEKRLEYLGTDEGKEWNRARAKSYYDSHKDQICEKRKAWYLKKKAASSTTPVPSE